MVFSAFQFIRITALNAGIIASILLMIACNSVNTSSLSKERIEKSRRGASFDPLVLVKTFDLSNEVQWSADNSAEKFKGLALSIPRNAIDGSNVTMTMKLSEKTALNESASNLAITGDKEIIASGFSLVLPEAVAKGFSLSSDVVLVKFTSAATGVTKYLPKANFAILPSGVVLSVKEWGTVSLVSSAERIKMSVTSPAAGSFINKSNASNFAVAGTCAIENSTISFSVSAKSDTTKTSLDASSAVTCQNGKWSASLNLGQFSNGSLTLYVDNKADTGQTSDQQSLALVKDTSAPSVTLSTTSNAVTNVSPIPVTAEFSESVTGFTLSDISTTNGTVGDLIGSGTSYSFNVYPVSNGNVTVNVAATVANDLAGNTNTVSNTLSVSFSSTAPTLTLTSIATAKTKISPIPVAAHFSAAVTGFTSADLSLVNGTVSNFAGSGDDYTFDVTPTGQGTVTVDVAAGAAIDSATTPSLAAAQLSRIYDTVAPTVSITTTSAAVTNLSSIPVTVTFNEVVTGFVVGDLTIGNGSASSFAGSGTTYTFNVAPTGNGAVTVDIAANAAQDEAANNSLAATQLTRTYDGTAPTISVSAPTAGAYVNNSNKTAVTVSGSCSENAVTVTVNVTSAGTTVNPAAAVTCNTGSTPNWTSSVDTSSLTDGTLSVTASQTDAAGNSTTSTNVAVTKDTSNPAAVATMGWTQSSPTTATALSAAWTVSTASDLASQAAQFYTGSSCNTASGGLQAIASSSTATYSYTAGVEGNFSYKITSYDTAGNSSVSACSTAIAVATTAVTANSTITGTSPIAADGSSTSTVTITLKNTNNDAVVNVTPTFSATNTGSTNSYAACSATNSSGVSTCTFTSTKAETKTLSIATPISKADGNVTFQNSAASNIVFSTDPSSGYTGTALSTQPIVTIRDANNNTVTTGPDATGTVTLTLQSGTGSLGGTVSMAAVAGVADFSGKGLNLSTIGAKTLRATKSSTTGSGGVAALTADSGSFTIANAAPTLSAQSNQVFPSSYLNQGATLSVDFNNTFPGTPDDVGMTYACTFDRVVDGAVAAGTACTSLVGTVTFNTSTGAFSWIPDATVFGSFEIKVVGTNAGGTDNKIFSVAVRPAYVTTNLLGDWDAQFADLTKPYTSANDTWKDLTGSSANDGISNSTTNATWTGSGTYSSPYALSLNGSAKIDFGSSVMSGQTKMMMSSWVKPADSTSITDAVILGNSSNASGNGFTVRQKPSYRDAVMALSPVGYWRLGETTGTTAVDLGSGANNGTYTNGPVLGQSGGLTGDTDYAVNFDGTNDFVDMGNNNNLKLSSGTISAWIKTSSPGSGYRAIAVKEDAFGLFLYDSKLAIHDWNAGALKDTGLNLADGYWHFVAVSFDSGVASGTKIYSDGVLVMTTTITIKNQNKSLQIGENGTNAGQYFTGQIDDVSLFTTKLSNSQISQLYKAGITGKKMDFVVGKSYQDVVLADNPVGYWRLGEAVGKNAVTDISQTGGNGSYGSSGITKAATGAISGDDDTAITLNGSANSVSNLGTNSVLDFGTGDFSVELWFKTTYVAGGGSTYPGLISKQALANRTGFDFVQADSSNIMTFDIFSNNVNVGGAATTGAINDGLWHHAVGVRSSGNLYLYVDNVAYTGATGITQNITTTQALLLGQLSTSSNYFTGSLDEVALYNVALSSAQIAAHYNAGLGTYGGRCRSTSSFANTWAHVSSLFSGSAAALFVNGRQECTVALSNGLTTPATNLFAGSTSTLTKPWTGSIADLKVYGTSNGTAVGTSTDVKTNFDKTADRYRETPVGNIVTTGLILNLDAANASRGLSKYSNGCSSTDLSWFDLSPSALISTLSGFSSCGSSTGWNGDGTTTISGAAGPYRLKYDGVNDKVTVSQNTALNMTSTWSVSVWVNFSGFYSGECLNNSILAKGHDQQNGFYGLSTQDTAYACGGAPPLGIHYPSFVARFADGGALTARGTTNLSAGTWFNLVGTFDGSNMRMYVNGALEATTPTTKTPASNSSDLTVGGQNFSGYEYWLNGSIPSVMIYNKTLSASEITQNCNAHKSRFSGAVCN